MNAGQLVLELLSAVLKAGLLLGLAALVALALKRAPARLRHGVWAAALAGAEARNLNEYPSWSPNLSSSLLHRCRLVYQELFKKKPEVKALHAGLECGVIGAKCNGMDMISIGPTIRNPHSPAESLNVPSVGKSGNFWWLC